MTPRVAAGAISQIRIATFQDKLEDDKFGPNIENSEIVKGLRKLAVELRARLNNKSTEIVEHAARVTGPAPAA